VDESLLPLPVESHNGLGRPGVSSRDAPAEL